MNESAIAQFIQLTQESHPLFEQLLLQLEREREALEQRDIEALQQSTEAKHQQLLAIENNIRARNEVLTLAGFSPSSEGLEALMSSATAAQRSEFDSLWEDLRQRIKSAQDATARNEQILTRSKQSVDQLMALLQGQRKSNVLYDPAGGTGNYAPQSRIGKA